MGRKVVFVLMMLLSMKAMGIVRLSYQNSILVQKITSDIQQQQQHTIKQAVNLTQVSNSTQAAGVAQALKVGSNSTAAVLSQESSATKTFAQLDAQFWAQKKAQIKTNHRVDNLGNQVAQRLDTSGSSSGGGSGSGSGAGSGFGWEDEHTQTTGYGTQFVLVTPHYAPPSENGGESIEANADGEWKCQNDHHKHDMTEFDVDNPIPETGSALPDSSTPENDSLNLDDGTREEESGEEEGETEGGSNGSGIPNALEEHPGDAEVVADEEAEEIEEEEEGGLSETPGVDPEPDSSKPFRLYTQPVGPPSDPNVYVNDPLGLLDGHDYDGYPTLRKKWLI